ncbi:MAG: NADH-quinone oxidoreductase subunit C [Candidatus Marsarchaeota archaeon]|nr:NADH-quinone oxidoreductase subunit C [Candidatus Marsarchaeota archaeon]
MRKQGFDYLKKITAVDYSSYLQLVYILYNTDNKKEEIVTVKLLPEKPEIDTVEHIYKAADWYERELSEMFGIKVNGRKAKRLLLEEWNGIDAPLRKSFIWDKDYRKSEDGKKIDV